MNNLKKSIKLISYSVGVKRQIAMSLVFLAIGIGIEICTGCSNVLGGFYIALIGTVPAQMILLVTVPSAVKASPFYRKITVDMFGFLIFLSELFCFTVVALIHGIYAAITPENADVSYTIVLLVAAVVFLTEAITPLMYKHYWAAFFILLVCVWGLFMPCGAYIYGDKSLHLAVWVYYLAGYVLVLLGMLVGMLVNHVFYKHELDPMTYKSMMKKLDGSL